MKKIIEFVNKTEFPRFIFVVAAVIAAYSYVLGVFFLFENLISK